MEESNIKKAPISEEDLDQVSAGVGSGAGYIMTVGNCAGGYIELYCQPNGQCNALARLYPGYQVVTFGMQNRGIDENGASCTYTYVNWNEIWGWANSCFLHR